MVFIISGLSGFALVMGLADHTYGGMVTIKKDALQCLKVGTRLNTKERGTKNI